MRTSYFEYSLSNSIHKFVMYQADWKAMDAFFDTLNDILGSLEKDVPLLSICDLTQSGFPTLHYNVVRVTRIMKAHNVKRINRGLVIHNDPHIAQLARVAMNVNPFIHVKFIHANEEDYFMQWLRTGHLSRLHRQ